MNSIGPLEFAMLFFASFLMTGIKGFQHRNINGKHKRLIVVFSFVMASFDLINITIVAHYGLAAILPVGGGSSLGMLTAIYLHDRFVAKKNPPV